MIYITTFYIIAKYNLIDFGGALFGALIIDVILLMTWYIIMSERR